MDIEWQDAQESSLSEKDTNVLHLLKEEDLTSFTFGGLKRRLGVHPESLSRALYRLEDKGIVEKVAIRDIDIPTDIVDYGVPIRSRPTIRTTNYDELKSGMVEINGRNVKVTSISSLKQAHKISNELKRWIEEGTFTLTKPIERLPQDTSFNPMNQSGEGSD